MNRTDRNQNATTYRVIRNSVRGTENIEVLKSNYQFQLLIKNSQHLQESYPWEKKNVKYINKYLFNATIVSTPNKNTQPIQEYFPPEKSKKAIVKFIHNFFLIDIKFIHNINLLHTDANACVATSGPRHANIQFQIKFF